MNCWEHLKCARNVMENCPAYPDKGLDCWKVTGTKCAGGMYTKATITEKVLFCRECSFYKQYAHKI